MLNTIYIYIYIYIYRIVAPFVTLEFYFGERRQTILFSTEEGLPYKGLFLSTKTSRRLNWFNEYRFINRILLEDQSCT